MHKEGNSTRNDELNNKIDNAGLAKDAVEQSNQSTMQRSEISDKDYDSNDSEKYYAPLYEWEDITTKFFEACSELELGELIHGEVFGLFDAMSAIEMMDPKMDVGMGFNKNDPAPHTFESAVEAGILKLANLENSELIGIFDSLFSCLVSWLEGHSLEQSLYTCLYLHMPNEIEDKSLRTFCLTIREMISMIKTFIAEGNVSEEEDFQVLGSSGIHFFMTISKAKVIALLKEAEDDLVKKAKKEENPEDTLAVMHRLRFLRFLFQSLHMLSPRKDVSPNETEIAEIQRHLSAALELVPLIRKTIEKGTQAESNSDAPNSMGFSPKVNQRNLPPTFPRTAKIKDRPSSLTFLEELVQRLKLACKVIHQKNYHSALNFFIDFSKKAGHCLLSRSILQILFFGNRRRFVSGTIPFEEFIEESIKQFIAPPVLMPKQTLSSNTQARNCVDSFLNICNVSTFIYLLEICGYNRARQRDKLGRLIEEGFFTLQDEAGRVDSYLSVLANKSEAGGQHVAYFGTWTLYHCLRVMSLYLLSGFELELYSVHEFIYIYWYLFEFLYSFIVSALNRAETLLIEQENYAAEQQSKTNSKQRKSKPKKKKQLKPYRQEIVFNHAMQNMCGGYYKVMGAFTKEEKIRQPMSKFDSEKIRFNHRFAPFAHLTSPPPIPYNEFKKMRILLLRLSSAELFLSAAKHFHQARTLLESIQNPDQEMTQMIQVAKVNFVVTNLLANGHKKDSKMQPDFDFSHHRYFPIIKLN